VPNGFDGHDRRIRNFIVAHRSHRRGDRRDEGREEDIAAHRIHARGFLASSSTPRNKVVLPV